MSNIIATIRLMPGQVGFYDPLSQIHLTIGMPQRDVYAGTNVTQLRKSVKSGRLQLVSGSFGPEAPVRLEKKNGKIVVTKEPVEKEKVVEPVTTKPTKEEDYSFLKDLVIPTQDGCDDVITDEEETTVEETIEEETVEQETVAEEAPVEEESKSKKTRSRKSKKAAE